MVRQKGHMMPNIPVSSLDVTPQEHSNDLALSPVLCSQGKISTTTIHGHFKFSTQMALADLHRVVPWFDVP